MIQLFSVFLFTLQAQANLDSHVHLFSHESEGPKKYLETAKLNGITHSFLLSMGHSAEIREILGPYSTTSYDDYIQQQNTFVTSLQNKDPSVFTAFCSIPWGYDRTKALVELNRCVSMGVKGIKAYPVRFFMTEKGQYNALNVRFDSNLEDLQFLNLLLDFSSKNSLIFGIHSSQMDVSSVVGFLYQSNYGYNPNLKVIFFHGFAPQNLGNLNLIRDHLNFVPNSKIFIEFSTAQSYLNSALEKPFKKIVNSFKTENLLFGSDAVSWSHYSDQKSALDLYKKMFSEKKLRQILKNQKILK